MKSLLWNSDNDYYGQEFSEKSSVLKEKKKYAYYYRMLW